MKTKFYWLALLASAAMIAQANAGGHHDGGGGGDNVVAAPPASGLRSVGPSIGSPPMRGYGGGGRVIYYGQRFSPVGRQSPATFRPYYIRPNGRTGADSAVASRGRDRQIASAIINRRNDARLSNAGTRAATNARPQINRAGERGNNLRVAWRNHVFAQRSANWQRNWDRRSDHWWHGHRCHFVNGSWIIFDLGFYPWDTFWYPYGNYYGYFPYSYNYDPGYYDSYGYQDEEYYGANSDDVTVQSADSVVANAQEKLAQQGYYRGGIDGILGPETSRAIMRFQSNQGLRVTGVLTRDTVEALGLRQVAPTNEEPTYD